ncbi:hypothetical protein Taro_001335 [Colocasia esculenta]|uniref:PdxS/SNZ N-terminal domain-containing protein n=1 Tax=Colocasia esculenta TaxID=4460 RepID=A0A843TDC5_COLES|nr:hypothetical protein [Colocasia esculenta]
MIRNKGEAKNGNVCHVRSVMGDIWALRNMDDDEVFSFVKCITAPYDLGHAYDQRLILPHIYVCSIMGDILDHF